MRRILDRIAALFDPNRHGPRLAGFACGATIGLLSMSLVHVAFNGGYSDSLAPPPQAYIIQ